MSCTDEAGKAWFILTEGTHRQRRDGKTTWHIPEISAGKTFSHLAKHFNLPKSARASSCLTWDEATAADLHPTFRVSSAVEIGYEEAVEMDY
jgi:hypothetical protein